jgi:hypothetical protein
MWMKRIIVCIAVLIITGVMAGTASASLIAMLGSDADTYLRDDVVRGADVLMDVRGGGIDFAGYLRFDLSGLGAGITIESATLTLTKVSGASRNDTITSARFALYGLNVVADNTPQNWDESTLTETGTDIVGLEWNGVVPLDLSGGRVTNLDMEDVAGITETVVNGGSEGGTVSVTGDPLVSFLQGRVDDNGLVTFIIGNDDGTDRGYGLATKENLTESYRPVLEITYIPEPATIALLGLGGLTLLRRRK